MCCHLSQRYPENAVITVTTWSLADMSFMNVSALIERVIGHNVTLNDVYQIYFERYLPDLCRVGNILPLVGALGRA